MTTPRHPNPNHSSNVTDEERRIVRDAYAGRLFMADESEALYVDDIVLRMRGAYDEEPYTPEVAP